MNDVARIGHPHGDTGFRTRTIPRHDPPATRPQRLVAIQAAIEQRPDLLGFMPAIARHENGNWSGGIPNVLGEIAVAEGSKLYVGPVAAEFGHELFFAALARYAAQFHEKTIVCSCGDRSALYADFATGFLDHGIQCQAACMWPRADQGEARKTLLSIKPPPNTTVLRPIEAWPHSMSQTRFVVYGQPDRQFRGVIALHARHRQHVTQRNWPAENWQALVEKLRERAPDSRYVSIGSLGAATCAPGTEDLRGLPLHRQMDVLRSATIAIGPSSGPMHLASLCKCPHVVWCGGGNRTGEAEDTIRRYERHWNPFHTPVLAVRCPSWQPSVESVYDWTMDMLGRLSTGEKT